MKKTTVLNAFEHNLKKNILAIEVEASIYRIIIGIYLYSLPVKLFIFSFIYLFIYLFIFLSHLFSLLFLTSILPIYHFFPLCRNLFYIIYYSSILLSHYVYTLLLLMLQYYLFNILYLHHIN